MLFWTPLTFIGKKTDHEIFIKMLYNLYGKSQVKDRIFLFYLLRIPLTIQI